MVEIAKAEVLQFSLIVTEYHFFNKFEENKREGF